LDNFHYNCLSIVIILQKIISLEENMMKKIVLLLASLLMTFPAFSDTTTTPTAASKPLPKFSETQNIDTVTTEKVQAALTKIKSLKGQAVSAASQDGTVTLQGSVENKSQEEAAINAAKSVSGVKEVNSQLTIKAGD
jgi:hyperosmotically inducible protein